LIARTVLRPAAEVLGWSEATLVPDEHVEALVRAMVDRFAAMGGVPLLAVFDRPKTVALAWRRDSVVTEWNSTFAGVALDFGLGIEVCWPCCRAKIQCSDMSPERQHRHSDRGTIGSLTTHEGDGHDRSEFDHSGGREKAICSLFSVSRRRLFAQDERSRRT
jgi:hypothetical protein